MTPLLAELAIAGIFIAAGYLIRWAQDGWNAATRDIDEAVAMVCKPCSWTDPAAPCTCPDKGCTAMACPKRGVRRG